MRSFDARCEEIREKLERSVGSLSSAVWERVVENGLIKDHLEHLDGYEGCVPWKELVSEVSQELEYEKKLYRQWLEASDSKVLPFPIQTRSYKREGSPTVEPWEAARAEANTMHLAELSNKHPRVRRFREEVLGDDWPLTKEQAEHFVSSPALARLPQKWFTDRGISLVEHDSSITEHRHPPPSPYLVRPGQTQGDRAQAYRDALQARKEQDYIDLFVSFERDGLLRSEQISVCPVGTPKLLLWAWIEYSEPNLVWANSVLDRLHSACKSLTRTVRRWEEDEAAYFILTGKAPFVVPLEAEIQFAPGAKVRGESRISNPITGHSSLDERLLEEASSPSAATITLKVEPWVSAESVKKFYRSVQKELVGNGKSSWERNLRVYTFVKRHRAEGVDDSRLPVRWNATAHVAWRYRSVHGFWQAYEAARRQVEEAEYNPLENRPRDSWRQT